MGNKFHFHANIFNCLLLQHGRCEHTVLMKTIIHVDNIFLLFWHASIRQRLRLYAAGTPSTIETHAEDLQRAPHEVQLELSLATCASTKATVRATTRVNTNNEKDKRKHKDQSNLMLVLVLVLVWTFVLALVVALVLASLVKTWPN